MMRFIKAGDTLVNLDQVTHIERMAKSDTVWIYLRHHGDTDEEGNWPDIEVDGTDGEDLWKKLCAMVAA